MNKQGYIIDAYKECLVVNEAKYQLLSFVEFSPLAIINAFIIPSS